MACCYEAELPRSFRVIGVGGESDEVATGLDVAANAEAGERASRCISTVGVTATVITMVTMITDRTPECRNGPAARHDDARPSWTGSESSVSTTQERRDLLGFLHY